MKIEFYMPESLKDISLRQYQKWLKLTDGKEIDLFLQQKMVEIFCGVPIQHVINMKALDVYNINVKINAIFEKEPKLVERFIFNNVEYGFIPKLDDITFGEYVDLDNYLNDWNNIHKALAILYRPVTIKRKGYYNIEVYESSENYDLRDVSMEIVLGSLIFFCNLKKELLKSMMNYLLQQKEVNLTTNLQDFLKNGDGINQFMDLHKVMSGGLMKSPI